MSNNRVNADPCISVGRPSRFVRPRPEPSRYWTRCVADGPRLAEDQRMTAQVCARVNADHFIAMIGAVGARWGNAQPDCSSTQAENCVQIRTEANEWNDYPCNDKTCSICYIP